MGTATALVAGSESNPPCIAMVSRFMPAASRKGRQCSACPGRHNAGSAMIDYDNWVYLRYVLPVNIITALIPSISLKGRANDPLLHSNWWPGQGRTSCCFNG